MLSPYGDRIHTQPFFKKQCFFVVYWEFRVGVFPNNEIEEREIEEREIEEREIEETEKGYAGVCEHRWDGICSNGNVHSILSYRLRTTGISGNII